MVMMMMIMMIILMMMVIYDGHDEALFMTKNTNINFEVFSLQQNNFHSKLTSHIEQCVIDKSLVCICEFNNSSYQRFFFATEQRDELQGNTIGHFFSRYEKQDDT